MYEKIKRTFLLLMTACFLVVGFSPDICKTASAAESTNTDSPAITKAKTKKNVLIQKNGKTYYYNKKGVKAKNCWQTIDGKGYYFTKDGSAATGWQTIQGNRYLFRKDGSARTGWYTTKEKTYYFSKKTYAMITGWKTISGKKYYFDTNGVMVKNYWINGKYLSKSGVYQKDKKMKITALQSKLTSAIRSYRGTWSVYVKNLDTGESFAINNRKIYAASVIKMYAMAAAYDRISQGRFSEASVSSTLKSMITVSSNDAFNTIVRKVGTSYINTWCRQNGYNDTNQGHGLSPSSNNYGLSNGTGSNVTTVKDCGKLLESIYRGTCVSKKASVKMLNLLKQQQRRSKIPAGVPSGVTVANKTGETNDTTHDAAIVFSEGADYILCVMGNVPGGAWYASSNITKISRITYDFFN